MGNCLGFGSSGVVAESCAASFQSVCYGGYTPAGSCFSICQSFGARGCGALSSVTGLVVFIIGAVMILLGVMFGFYPDMMGTVNSEDITKFAEAATEINLIAHYQYMIAVGVFMTASVIFYFCCSGLLSVASLVLVIVHLAFTATSLAQVNQYKSSPSQSGWQQRFLNSFYLGQNPYPRFEYDNIYVVKGKCVCHQDTLDVEREPPRGDGEVRGEGGDAGPDPGGVGVLRGPRCL